MNQVTTRKDLGNLTDEAGHDHTDEIVIDETDALVSAEKVLGTPVFNGKGERLGSIDSLMLDKREGRVAYAVMSFGGFLGLGERYHPLPWERLSFDTALDGYNIDLTHDELARAPHFDRAEIPFLTGDRRAALEDFYRDTRR